MDLVKTRQQRGLFVTEIKQPILCDKQAAKIGAENEHEKRLGLLIRFGQCASSLKQGSWLLLRPRTLLLGSSTAQRVQSRPDAISTLRQPSTAVRTRVMGIAAIDPRRTRSRRSPDADKSRPRPCLVNGTSGAQLANAMPPARNSNLVARCSRSAPNPSMSVNRCCE
jgi:hypothetical protein